ncbi:hypothetical protein GCM10027398_13890 [Azotobacter salinestris]
MGHPGIQLDPGMTGIVSRQQQVAAAKGQQTGKQNKDSHEKLRSVVVMEPVALEKPGRLPPHRSARLSVRCLYTP